jgi:hypothetical protein
LRFLIRPGVTDFSVSAAPMPEFLVSTPYALIVSL